MYCSNCGSQLQENAKFCSSCGQGKLEKKSAKSKWLLVGIFSTLVVAAVVGFGIYQTLASQNKMAFKEKTVDLEPVQQEQIAKEAAKTATIATSAEKEKTQIIKESMPKVFTILTAEGQGSGFLYKKGGYIVTNAHVAAGYTDVIVRNHNGQEFPAKVIGISNTSDVALLQANDYSTAEPFSLESEQSVIGTEVIAIGSPQGFENSASIGYLTGTDRDIQYDFIYEELYQIDAQIDQGSSGGPLLDGTTGKVIGINSLLYTNNTSFGFSIPLYTVAGLIDGWISQPMSSSAVAGVFNTYDEFVYSDASVEEEEVYYDEYEDFWNSYYENYPADNSYDDSYSEPYTDEMPYEEEMAVGEEETNFSFDEGSLESFILTFRDYYEDALDEEDFYWIQDMLSPESNAYLDLEEYVYDISGEGFQFDFTSNTVTGADIYENYAVVSTNEQFDFYNAAGDYTFYEKNKEYTVIIDASGFYQITDIYTLE